MIRAELTSHPLTPSQAVLRIDASVQHNAGSIDLSFVVSGQIAKIALPARRDASRADGLWHHTCFELFARSQSAQGYSEFNFSPSTQWAAYRFSAYREGMMDRELHRAPTVRLATSDERLQFDVQFAARDLPTPTELALTAVIEESSGVKSYWALHHHPDKPDFHYEHGFVLSLD